MLKAVLEEGALCFWEHYGHSFTVALVWCPWLMVLWFSRVLNLLVNNVSFAALLGLYSMVVVNGMSLWDGAWVLAKVGLKGA